MNKQQAIKTAEFRVIYPTDVRPNLEVLPLEEVKNIISQIHVPQKPVVPKFVAEWIEGCKRSGWHLQKALYRLDDDEKVEDWAYDENDDLVSEKIDIFARAWLDGYTVEKEKLYTVEIPNPNSAGGKLVLFKQQSSGRLILDMLNPNINKPKYLHITEAEIKQDFEWAWQWAKEEEVK